MLYPSMPHRLKLMHVLLHFLQYFPLFSLILLCFPLFSFILFACNISSVSHKICETPGEISANNKEIENVVSKTILVAKTSTDLLLICHIYIMYNNKYKRKIKDKKKYLSKLFTLNIYSKALIRQYSSNKTGGKKMIRTSRC